MEKNSHTKKIYCKILGWEILKSQCVPEDQRCILCSQYPPKIRFKRWDYVKNHLLCLADGGHHNLYKWTLLVNDEILESLYQAPLDFDKLQKEGMLEVQIENEWEGLHRNVDGFFVLESEIYRERFEKGDESAIFEFCKNFHFAFRSSWVVRQIEQWKLQKSKESLGKLNKLFKTYANAKGKTLSERLKDLFEEDKKICDEIVELQKKGLKADSAIKKVSSEKGKGFTTVKDIYYGYKADDQLKENLKRIKENLRKTSVDENLKKIKDGLEELVAKDIASGKSFSTILDDDNLKKIRDDLIRHKYMPAAGESFPEFIDPAIDKLFLRSDKFDSEYEHYKKMRFLYQGVKFQDDPPTLLRINIDENPYKNLSLIVDKMVKETGISEHELKDIYKTLRGLEIQRNYDNDKNREWIETKDIINQELSA